MSAHEPLVISTHSEPGEVSLSVAGELDAGTADQFDGEILTALLGVEDGGTLVVDLSEVGFMDSSALRVLVGAIHACRQRDVRLVVRDPSPTVAQLLDITKLSGELTIETS